MELSESHVSGGGAVPGREGARSSGGSGSVWTRHLEIGVARMDSRKGFNKNRFSLDIIVFTLVFHIVS